MQIFIGGLPVSIVEDDLLETFSEFGEVSSVKIVRDKATGVSRRFGFVEMPNANEAMEAIEALHEATVEGQTVSVKVGEERDKKAQEQKAAKAKRGGVPNFRRNTSPGNKRPVSGPGRNPNRSEGYRKRTENR